MMTTRTTTTRTENTFGSGELKYHTFYGDVKIDIGTIIPLVSDSDVIVYF